MKIEYYTLRKVSQTEKNCMISLICRIKKIIIKNSKSQIQRTDWWMPAAGVGGGGDSA